MLLKIKNLTKIGAVVSILFVVIGTVGFFVGRYGKSIQLLNYAFFIFVIITFVLILKEKIKKHE